MRKLMWFSVGFVTAAFVGLSFLRGEWYFLAVGFLAVLLAAILVLMGKFPKLRILAVVLFGCILGFCWIFLFDSCYLAVPRAADGQAIEMTVTALDFPKETDHGCEVECIGYLNDKPYRMELRLPKPMEFRPGDQLTCRFFLSCTLPDGTRDSEYDRSNGIFLNAVAKRTPDVTAAEKTPWFAYPAYVRRFVREALFDVLPEKEAGFAVALLIGDTDGIDYETDVSFKRSGIRHIVAVSGLHVTILFSLLYVLFGKRVIPAVLIGIPVMCFFAAVAGLSPSITRACVMHTLMALALLFGREYDPPTALSFAVLVILALNPWTLIHVGFQLSVACMLGIFIIAPSVQGWFMSEKRFGKWKGKKRRFASFVASSVGVSMGAAIFSAPLCAYYFGIVSLVSVLTNFLTLWVITYIFYGILLICLLVLLLKPLALFAGYMVMIPIQYVLWTAKIISAFPLAAIYMDSSYMLAWFVFAYVLLGAFLLMKKKQPLILFCCACISLCVALIASWTEPLQDECRLTMLDTGQGQSLILQSEGRSFLVDCGGNLDENAANLAANRLLSQGIDALDGVIVTHFDRDHAGGVPHLLTQVKPGMLYLPNCVDSDGTSEVLLHNRHPKKIVDQMTTIVYGNVCITLIPSNRGHSDNENGLCVLFQSQNCDILITGDRSISGELELMEAIELPELDVLVVGHHGSESSTSEMLLQQTKPKIAMISVGANNLYGHPADETLTRLRDAGSEIYRTDIHGTILFRGEDDG